MKMLESFSHPPARIEMHLIKSRSMKALNQRYRGKNKTTDILSFSSKASNCLGSIAIDVDTAKEQAKFYGHSLERELSELFIHGVLHLLGLDHHNKKQAEQMARSESYFVSLLNQSCRGTSR